MAPSFDPQRKRKYWLDFALKYETEFVPDQIPAQGQPLYVSVLTNCLVTGYLLGLTDRVRPTLEAVVAWMQNRPEPALDLYDGPRDFWHDNYYALYAWRRTLGLATWLCGMEGAERHFGAALSAEWDCWRKATPDQRAEIAPLRRARLGEYLALALAANQPEIGFYFFQEPGVPELDKLPALPLLGVYGCLRLKEKEAHRPEFIGQARQFLDVALWPDFLSEGRYTEPALWMKFLFHDSGEARTPEGALARLYDFMPGVQRPDFVDW